MPSLLYFFNFTYRLDSWLLLESHVKRIVSHKVLIQFNNLFSLKRIDVLLQERIARDYDAETFPIILLELIQIVDKALT